MYLREHTTDPCGFIRNGREQQMVRHDLVFVRPAGLPVRAGESATRARVKPVERHRGVRCLDEVGGSHRMAASVTAAAVLPERSDHLLANLLERHAERLKDARG